MVLSSATLEPRKAACTKTAATLYILHNQKQRRPKVCVWLGPASCADGAVKADRGVEVTTENGPWTDELAVLGAYTSTSPHHPGQGNIGDQDTAEENLLAMCGTS